MTYTDTMGYAVSTMSSEALAAYEQGVSLWLRQRSGAVDALTHAVAVDPHFALAHCTRAYVAWRMGQVETALAAHQQAMALADDVHEEREHLHLQTVDAMRTCNGAAALHHLEAIADRYPADRMAMRVLSFNYIARGDYQSGVTQARHSLAACPDDPQFLTMAAFFLEQSNEDPDEGLDLWSGCAVCLRAKRVGSGPLWGRICLRVKWPASAAISKRRFVSWPQRCSASTKWEGESRAKGHFSRRAAGATPSPWPRRRRDGAGPATLTAESEPLPIARLPRVGVSANRSKGPREPNVSRPCESGASAIRSG